MKSRKALLNHRKLCFGNRTRRYPARNKETGEVQKLKFKNFSYITHHPFVSYADSESFLSQMYVQKGENTIGIQRHIPSCFGVYHTIVYQMMR